MKLKTISIEYGRVIPLGQYDSFRASCTLGAELGDDEDANTALESLWEMARESVRGQVYRVLEHRQKQRAVAEARAQSPPNDGTDPAEDETATEAGG